MTVPMLWRHSTRGEQRTRMLADRHYNRQKIGATQFVPPGRCAVFYAGTATGEAFWVTSWPFGQYVQHRWPGAWVCSAFRNEGADRAQDLIVSALAATRAVFGDPPALGLVTFIDRSKVQPIMVRSVPTFGRTYKLAGFEDDGETKGGLLALRIRPERMPAPQRALMELEVGIPC